MICRVGWGGVGWGLGEAGQRGALRGGSARPRHAPSAESPCPPSHRRPGCGAPASLAAAWPACTAHRRWCSCDGWRPTPYRPPPWPAPPASPGAPAGAALAAGWLAPPSRSQPPSAALSGTPCVSQPLLTCDTYCFGSSTSTSWSASGVAEAGRAAMWLGRLPGSRSCWGGAARVRHRQSGLAGGRCGLAGVQAGVQHPGPAHLVLKPRNQFCKSDVVFHTLRAPAGQGRAGQAVVSPPRTQAQAAQLSGAALSSIAPFTAR